ncbi:hypothetical protein, partial [Aliarcobacter butzleri]|uniref:hypothetical protein n=1 Tax=Aliarcobacter butzleri TaxID=28197 RepID=UPI002B24A7D6
NTAGSPCGNVGHRQLFKFLSKAFPKLVSITTFGEAFFSPLCIFNPFIFTIFLAFYLYLVILYFNIIINNIKIYFLE